MSISDEIEKLQDNLENSYTAVENKGGTLPENQCFDNLPDAIGTIETGGNLTTLNVTPTTSAQTITPTGDVDGYDEVNVAAVTNAIDSNISAPNIVSGKSILGVNGSATVLNGETRSVSLTNKNGQTFTPSSGKNAITSITITPYNQARTVTPSTSQQSLTVNSGYSGNGTITVNAVTSSIDSNIVASKIKKDVVILGVTGNYEGTGASISSLNVTPSTSAQTITASGGVDGYSPINVSAVTASIDANIIAANIVSGKSILGVNGSATVLNGETKSVSLTNSAGQTFTPSSGKNGITSITVIPSNQARSVTPTTSQQTLTVNSGYSGNGTITVGAVTASIDANITAANIVSGKSILGVSGSATVLNGETRTVSITSTSGNTFTPSSGKNGITSIKVTPTNKAQTITPSTSSQSISVPSGYSGNGTITVNAVDASIDSNIQAKYIRNGIDILGVTGTHGIPVGVDKIACSDYTTWYITTDEELYGTGTLSSVGSGGGNTSSFTLRKNNVKKIVSNGYTTWYLTSDNELYGCGANESGQQSKGSTSTRESTFTKRAENVKDFACSNSTTWYIDNNDILYGCGKNDKGQQGTGNTNNVLTFTQKATNVKKVACSDLTTWYIDNNDILYGCGYNTHGEQGSGNTSDVLTFTQRGENVKDVFCFYSSTPTQYTTWYLTNDNKLYGCGSKEYLGIGSSSGNQTTFVQIAANIVFFTGSTTTNWYINTSNDLYGCGSGSSYAQGSGNTSSVYTFTKRAENVKKVTCSYYTTWYIDNNDDLYGCGKNDKGQQGTGDTTSVQTFTKKAENVKDVACSLSTTWYIDTNYNVYGCGACQGGAQGNGSTSTSTNVTTFTKRN